MKNLFVIRHSKAKLNEEGEEDFERALNKSGEEGAKFSGKWISNLEINLEKIFSSSAVRSKQTTEILAKQLKIPPKIVFESNLYLADEYDLLEYIKLIDDKLNNIAIIGHEPGLKRLILMLTGSFKPGLDEVLNRKFSTSSVAIISLNIPFWSSLNEREGVLSEYFNPKMQ